MYLDGMGWMEWDRWMNARVSLSLSRNLGARKSIGESGVYIQLFFLKSNDNNRQQSTINNQVGTIFPSTLVPTVMR